MLTVGNDQLELSNKVTVVGKRNLLFPPFFFFFSSCFVEFLSLDEMLLISKGCQMTVP